MDEGNYPREIIRSEVTKQFTTAGNWGRTNDNDVIKIAPNPVTMMRTTRRMVQRYKK